ncbi:MAG TPA: dihydrodipicolinate synthase family protein, partial [Pirellulales bacterium]|nr:dihydrodipicolinate synthase family protein [Pirellulales bacterium]
MRLDSTTRQALDGGMVIPACPLALDGQRRWDERRQRALVRYYLDAGAGGIAVAVHTTQFAIREPRHGLFRPLLQLITEEMTRFANNSGRSPLRVGGICGDTPQALAEARALAELGFHAGLLNLSAAGATDDDALVAHCRRVAEIIPVFGFYLSPAVGGRLLSFAFWRKLCEVENLVAIKIAAFNRYQTLDVIRAVIEAGRDDVALYTGNDDNIVLDLLMPRVFLRGDRRIERRIVGGLLGQ